MNESKLHTYNKMSPQQIFRDMAKKAGYKKNPLRAGYMTKEYKKWTQRQKRESPMYKEYYNHRTKRWICDENVFKQNSRYDDPILKSKFPFLKSEKRILTNKVLGLRGPVVIDLKGSKHATQSQRVFEIPKHLRNNFGQVVPDLFEQYLQEMLSLLAAETKALLPRHGKPMGLYMPSTSRIQFGFVDAPEVTYNGSIFNTDALVSIRDIKKKLEKFYLEYQDDDTMGVNKISIEWINDPPQTGEGAERGICKHLITKQWFVPDKYSDGNCFWRSLWVCEKWNSDPKFDLKQWAYEDDDRMYKKLGAYAYQITSGAKDRYKKAKNSQYKRTDYTYRENHTDLDDVEEYVKQLDRGPNEKRSKTLKIYNNAFELIHTFAPKKHTPHPDRTYEIQFDGENNHFRPMLRWEDIPLDREDYLRSAEARNKSKLNTSTLIDKPNGCQQKNPLVDDYIKHNVDKPKCLCCNGTDVKLSRSLKTKKYFWKCCKCPTSNCYVKCADDMKDKIEELGGLMTRKPTAFDCRFAAWDIEATSNGTEDGCFKSYMCYLAWYPVKQVRGANIWVFDSNKGVERRGFHGLDCLTQMCDFISDNAKQFHKYTFYAHNGARFDLMLLIQDALDTHQRLKIESRGSIHSKQGHINLNLKCGKHTISMKDSYKILVGTLDSLTKEFDVEHKKLTGSVKFKDITIQNYNKDLERYERMKRYCESDTIGLLEVLRQFAVSVHKDTQINITNCYTGSTLATKHFYENFYDPVKYPLYTPSSEMDRYVRNSYFGGRTECFQLGFVKGPIYYFDFTSLYPSQMVKPLPYGHPQKHSKEKTIKLLSDISFYGFVRVIFYTYEQHSKSLPLHAFYDKKQGKLLFRHFHKSNAQELTLFSEEYYLGLETGMYHYEVLDGVSYQSAEYYKKCIEQAVRKKQKASAAGNTALKQTWKTIANSSYGAPAINVNDKESVKILKTGRDNWSKYLAQGALVRLQQRDQYTICHVRETLKTKKRNVALSAATTSYSRMLMYQLMSDIISKGGQIYYCDTDSVMCNIDIANYKDLMKRYMWDGIHDLLNGGEELGSLKNEAHDIITVRDPITGKKNKAQAKQLKREMIKRNNGGSIAFDGAIFKGLKFYALRLGDYEICKCKGGRAKGVKDGDEYVVPPLTFDDYHKEVITQNLTQFVCPVTNHTTDNESKWCRIKPTNVEKSFKEKYNKGTVDPKTKRIAPFYKE